ncbi:MAG: alpha-amylase family glycosyl hydrolase [Phocaeicola sp.]
MKQKEDKMVIYQVLPRLFGNTNKTKKENGSLQENGCGKMDNFTSKALLEIKKLGATHIWYTGVIEHATCTDYSAFDIPKDHPAIVKGKAGSPYAIKDYYNISPNIANDIPHRMQEFEALVERTHNEGMKVIIDFVPNHVARQYNGKSKPKNEANLGENDDTNHSFNPQNNFYYVPQTSLGGEVDLQHGETAPYEEYPAKATGNDRFDAYPQKNDWYETIKLNYGVDYVGWGRKCFSPTPNTWIRMRNILLFWAAKGIDGFRCDMAEMVPVEFWAWTIPQIKEHYPDILFIAEVYNPNEYRNYLHCGKFDYLYDKVGLYDTLRAITCGYGTATSIQHNWQNLSGIEKQMLNFLENHDEQRIGSDFFAGNGRKAIPAMIVTACINTNPVMVYFGQELGERGMEKEGFSGKDGRTTIFDYWSIDSIQQWMNDGKFNEELLDKEQKNLRAFYTTLLNLCNNEAAISQGEFFDLTYANLQGVEFNEHRHYAFLRKYENELLLIVVNFDCNDATIGVQIPMHAFEYLEIPVQESYKVKELLKQKSQTVVMKPDQLTTLKIKGYSGQILKFKL